MSPELIALSKKLAAHPAYEILSGMLLMHTTASGPRLSITFPDLSDLATGMLLAGQVLDVQAGYAEMYKDSDGVWSIEADIGSGIGRTPGEAAAKFILSTQGGAS